MICPKLTSEHKRRLQGINRHLEAKWNRRFLRWDIWFDNHCGKAPYIVESAGVIDDRLFTSLRHAFWFSQNIMRNVARMNDDFKRTQAKKLKDEEDLHLDMGKEVAPLLRTMKDAGTSSHGNSKFLFPGADLGGGA